MSVALVARLSFAVVCCQALLAQHTWVPLNPLGQGGFGVADSPLPPWLLRPLPVIGANLVQTFAGGAFRQRADVLPTQFGDAQASVFDAGNQRIVVYTASGAVCTFDGARWAVIAAVGGPSPRVGPALAYDLIHDAVVLFGGAVPGAFGPPLGDTWLLQGNTWTQVVAPGPAPLPRKNARLAPAVVQGNLELLLFGGNGQFSFGPFLFEDTWTWNGTAWTQQSPSVHPPARESTALAIDPQSGQTLLYGGSSVQSWFSDAWAWTGTDWLQVAAPGPTIEGPQLLRDAGRLLLFGRNASDLTTTAYAWQQGAWSAAYQEPPLPPVFGEAAAFDSVRNEIVRFGGRELYGQALRDDTWTWNGAWQPTAAGPAPSPRQWAAMAFDALRAEVVLFGGVDAVGVLGDTWTWNGAAWTQRLPTVSPPARGQASASWHPGRGTVVLFGGGSTGYLTDTWEWNGVDWAPIVTSAVPPARRATLAFDSARSVLALHSSVWPAGDLWELQAGGWTQASTVAPYGGVLLYDPATAGLVVLSGNSSADYVAGGWVPRSQSQPSNQIVTDPQRGGILSVQATVLQSTPAAATTSVYGSGCGPLGEVTCSLDRTPGFDAPMSANVRTLSPGTPTFLFLGLAQASVPFGPPGCTIHIDSLLGNFGLLAAPSGWATFDLLFPPLPGTIGLDVFAQAVTWYGGPLGFSNGVAMRLGL